MKFLFSLLTVVLSLTIKAQTAKPLKFSPYESLKFEEHELSNKDFEFVLKVKAKRDSVWNTFLYQFLIANGVDPKKVSVKADSFFISKEGLKLKLRK
jgi:hypothetical protein